jgi:nucleoside-diphosphate-sugar epimerase
VKHFVHCGTIWVYGASTQVPTTENERKEPFEDYGIRKLSIMETVHHVHCADVAAAFISAIKRREASLGQNFHVVSSAALTLRGYAARMAEWFGRSPRMKFLPWEEWSQTVSEKDALVTWDHIAHSPNYSIEKARSLLGYEPRYSSLAAVKESVEWLVAEGVVSRG